MLSTTCDVINAVDKKSMKLVTTWSNEEVAVIILRKDMLPLKGVALITDLVARYSHSFVGTEEEYIEQIKTELSGLNSDLEFHLINNKLSWKKKKMWTRGEIDCKLLNDTLIFSDEIFEIITRNAEDREALTISLKNNEDQQRRIEELEQSLQELTKLADTMQQEICKKFIVLLNEKKKENKKLQEKLKSLSKEPVFDLPTDESENDSSDERGENESSQVMNVTEDNNLNKFDRASSTIGSFFQRVMDTM